MSPSAIPEALYIFNELILDCLYSRAAGVLLIFLLPVLPTGAIDLDQCLSDIRNTTWRVSRNISSGGTDHHGRPAALTNLTTAITYTLCVAVCGSGSEPIRWLTFSQQFSSGLLNKKIDCESRKVKNKFGRESQGIDGTESEFESGEAKQEKVRNFQESFK